MSAPQTETLDRLYLEWSQFTQARNYRETQLIKALRLVEIRLATLGFDGRSSSASPQDKALATLIQDALNA